MAEKQIGWALFGKSPGSFQDYAVIADSGWPISSATYETTIRKLQPRQIGARGSNSPDAPPRLSFGTLRTKADAYQFVARTEWIDVVDGAGRPVMQTLMVCARYVGEPVGYSALYERFRRPDLLLPNQGSDGPVREDFPTRSLQELAGLVQERSELAAEVAAALLERRTVSIPYQQWAHKLEDRIRFFDAVAALLPGPARMWLTASTWSEPAHKSRPMLAFTDRPAEDDYRPGNPGRLGDQGRRYVSEILRHQANGATSKIVALMNGSRISDQDAGKVVLALTDIDLSDRIRDELKRGRADLPQIRRLLEVSKQNELTRNERADLLAVVIGLVDRSDELAPFAPLYDPRSTDVLVAKVAEWLKSGLVAEVRDAVDFARVGGGPQVASDLVVRIYQQGVSDRVLAAMVSVLEPRGLDQSLVRLVGDHPETFLRIVLGLLTLPEQAGDWYRTAYHLLDLETARSTRPVIEVISALLQRDETLPLGWEVVDAVFEYAGSQAILGLVQLVQKLPGSSADREMTMILRWLLDNDEIVPVGDRLGWRAAILPPSRTPSAHREAMTDLLLGRWNVDPQPDIQVMLSSADADLYLDTGILVLVQARERSEQLQADLMAGWLRQLPAGWPYEPVAEAVSWMFQKLSTGLGSVADLPLQQALLRIVHNYPDLEDSAKFSARFSRWLPPRPKPQLREHVQQANARKAAAGKTTAGGPRAFEQELPGEPPRRCLTWHQRNGRRRTDGSAPSTKSTRSSTPASRLSGVNMTAPAGRRHRPKSSTGPEGSTRNASGTSAPRWPSGSRPSCASS